MEETLAVEVVPVAEVLPVDFRLVIIENKWSGLRRNSYLTIFIFLINHSFIRYKNNILGLDRQVESK